jgi:hypothetical protein
MRFKYQLIVWAVFGLICTVSIGLTADLQKCRKFDGNDCVYEAYDTYADCVRSCYYYLGDDPDEFAQCIASCK